MVWGAEARSVPYYFRAFLVLGARSILILVDSLLTKIFRSGDIYNVIWDPIAVDGCRLEFAPADYPRVSPLDIGRNVEAKDMTEFFVRFMATDQ
jgi:hypothetical protein